MRKVHPHGYRGGTYPLMRAFTTTLLREITFYTLIADMYRGTPAAYVTLVGYDEVAHHSGVRAPDALAVLRRIDQQFARLEKVLPTAPRPYHFIVLSDHGQSQGATFKQRYGVTLGDLVQRLMAPDQEVAELNYAAEQWGYLSAFLTETSRVGDTAVTRMTRSAIGDRTSDGMVDLGPGRAVMATTKGEELPEVTVLASGNLGLIFFNELPGRQTDADILARYPEVLPGLTQHAGVGFVMVRSTAHGPVAIGRDGIHFLVEGRAEGTDPLAPYGPLAVRHLRRVDGFSNAPDILVNSMYDATTDEVCAFEELIGCHGGLGGLQMHPFLLAPVALPVPTEPIIGAAAIYHVLKGWQARPHDSAAPAPAPPAASAPGAD